MSDQELLALCKLNRRKTSDTFNLEITELIKQAKADIETSCNTGFDSSDPMHCKAVVMFVQANFGDGDDKARAVYQAELSKISTRGVSDDV